MSALAIKLALAIEARKHGFELIKANCRSNFFHIRRGDEVRLGHVYRGISREGIREAINTAAEYGSRLDQDPQSHYFFSN